MLFGMPTLIEEESLTGCAALCGELGLSFIELNMNLPAYQPGRIKVKTLRAIAETYGLDFTIHMDENLNPFDFNPLVARAYQATLLRTIDLAQQLNVSVINLHLCPGVWFTLPQQKVFLYEKYEKIYRSNVREFRSLCQQAVGENGPLLCLENTNWQAASFLQRTVDMLLESPIFALTYDVGHDFVAGGQDGMFIIERKDRIGHIHLHDALPDSDHLPLGTGQVDISRTLSLADKAGCRVVLETKTTAALKQSVAYLHSHDYL